MVGLHTSRYARAEGLAILVPQPLRSPTSVEKHQSLWVPRFSSLYEASLGGSLGNLIIRENRGRPNNGIRTTKPFHQGLVNLRQTKIAGMTRNGVDTASPR